MSPTCLVTFERNRYSVPASFANRRVSLHVYPDRLVVVAEGQTVCTHARIIERSHHKPGKVIYDWRHYLALAIVLGPMADKGSLQRKPGALRNGAPFTEMPEAFRRLQDHMLRKEGGDREMVDILSLVLHHDQDAVLCAVDLALEAGVPTKTHILNLLHRLIDYKQTDHPEVDPPDSLALETAPKNGISVVRTRKHKVTTDSDHKFNISPNLLNRDFTADKPNQKWAGDISYVWTREGWLYLAVILDLHSRRVIGWAVSNRMKRDLAIRALRMAIAFRAPPKGCIHHTDRGSQYCSHDYQKILRQQGFKVSMSGKGNCYDNAAVETFFKTIKAELIWRQSWETRRQAEMAIFEYINGFYNPRRRHSALGWKSPVALEWKVA